MFIQYARHSYYALQPGDISIEEAALENNIQFIKNEYARQIADAGRMFDDFANAIFPAEAVINETVTLKSDPVNITVKPLPEKNKPDFFNGAVGTFSIDAMLQKPLFSTDEAGKLSVMISGSGNMQLLTAPDIEWPKGIESFEPVFSDDLVKTTVPVSGTKKFEYSFAANDTGHYTLPPIRFSYFDPVAGNYKIIATAPIVFQVTKGSGHPVLLAAPVVKAEEPSFINRFIYHRWWIIIIVGLLIIGGLITWLIKERLPAAVNASGQQTADAGVIEQVIESSAINQQNVFSGTEKCMSQDDCIGFYNVLNTELKQFLAQKFLIDVNHINSNSITRVMDKKGIENKIVLKLQELMQKLEWQLYAPFERNEKMNTLYQEAHDIVQMINFNEITHL